MGIVHTHHVVNSLMVLTNYVVELDIRNTKPNSVEIFSRGFVNTVLDVSSYITLPIRIYPSNLIQPLVRNPLPD